MVKWCCDELTMVSGVIKEEEGNRRRIKLVVGELSSVVMPDTCLIIKYVLESYHNNKENYSSLTKKFQYRTLQTTSKYMFTHVHTMSHDKVYLATIYFSYDVSSLSNAISFVISLQA